MEKKSSMHVVTTTFTARLLLHVVYIQILCCTPRIHTSMIVLHEIYFLSPSLLNVTVNQTDEVLNKIDLQSPADGILGSGMEGFHKL